MTITKDTVNQWRVAIKHLDANPQETAWHHIVYDRGSHGRWIKTIVARYSTDLFEWYDSASFEGMFHRNILDLFPEEVKPDEASNEPQTN